MKASALKRSIVLSLRRQGFRVTKGRILTKGPIDKDRAREFHSQAVAHKIEKARNSLARHENHLLRRLASGEEIDPTLISPRLEVVKSRSENELLFRYAALHWSIPVSSGYGRRLRFLVIDEQNDKLIGIIGLGDPVFALRDRDTWIGWDRTAQRRNLVHVMDAFALGAVPPYSTLLCGKLVAMLVASNQVRDAFKRKYGDRESIIQKKSSRARLALITTTSALGRSSIYNRLKFHDELVFTSAGFTAGTGEFHFANGLYSSIWNYAMQQCKPTAKQKDWGTGFRNRREVLKKVLPSIGLSSDCLYHGIQREIFMVPLAKNSREFLCGENKRLRWHHQYTTNNLTAWFRERWLLPRIQTKLDYLSWTPDQWQLWH
jgi:hypothetical protein